ncbi:MAG: nitrous oxide reductase accessory protein NosL [Desulfobulbaceae bacterium]|nr:nitrous oxide reductase accessory protein NosL [Desulfobulbaceae bacterium]
MVKRYGAVMVMAVLLASAAQAEEREGCRLCGMYIDQYQQTSAVVTGKGGEVDKTCGVADMLRLVSDAGGEGAFSSVTVHDWVSGKETAAADATYVIGSDLVPDMIPNIIAFADQDGANKFMADHGGQTISFSQALQAISPMGMTMPNRVNSAVPPPKGALSGGVGYMSMVMDNLKMGSDDVSKSQFLSATASKVPAPMVPKKMEASGMMVMANYGITDKVSLTAKLADLDKTMTSEMRMDSTERVTENSGITDLDLKLRYNLWRDDYYSKFVTLMANVTLPTGDFDTDFANSTRNMPGLQMGTGSINFGGGILGSMRFGDFWLHGELSHLVNRENGDDYDFGDVTKIGAALHYTPNYDVMLGLELDATDTDKNEFKGVTMDNSGGRAVTLTAVASWRFLSALGGNFNLNGSYGAPLYQDVNWYGLETDYAATVMLNFTHRFNY